MDLSSLEFTAMSSRRSSDECHWRSGADHRRTMTDISYIALHSAKVELASPRLVPDHTIAQCIKVELAHNPFPVPVNMMAPRERLSTSFYFQLKFGPRGAPFVWLCCQLWYPFNEGCKAAAICWLIDHDCQLTTYLVPSNRRFRRLWILV